MEHAINNILVIATTCVVLFILFHKRLLTSPTWRATITPLASIIGSGFLVSAPLLLLTTGNWAAVAMFGIVTIAYMIGSALRYNIRHLEPLLTAKTTPFPWIIRLDTLSKPILGFAYIIAVAFYIKLLSAFVIQGFGITDPLLEKMLTTILLLFIGSTGKSRGLHALENLEGYSVNIKLAIIVAVIIGHLIYNIELFLDSQWFLKLYPHGSMITTFRKLLGMLLIIQGFETSRFIGHTYSQGMRIRTMRYAQIISGCIYVTFILTTMVVFNDIHTISETTIIDLCRLIAPLLPILLIIAATMSQFSAAVAVTVGSGGLLSEATHHKLKVNTSYLVITVLAIVLTWLTNIYEIIVYASKAYALFYAIQLLITCALLIRQNTIAKSLPKLMMYASLLCLMLLVITFGIPVK